MVIRPQICVTLSFWKTPLCWFLLWMNFPWVHISHFRFISFTLFHFLYYILQFWNCFNYSNQELSSLDIHPCQLSFLNSCASLWISLKMIIALFAIADLTEVWWDIQPFFQHQHLTFHSYLVDASPFFNAIPLVCVLSVISRQCFSSWTFSPF